MKVGYAAQERSKSLLPTLYFQGDSALGTATEVWFRCPTGNRYVLRSWALADPAGMRCADAFIGIVKRGNVIGQIYIVDAINGLDSIDGGITNTLCGSAGKSVSGIIVVEGGDALVVVCPNVPALFRAYIGVEVLPALEG